MFVRNGFDGRRGAMGVPVPRKTYPQHIQLVKKRLQTWIQLIFVSSEENCIL